MGHAQNLTVVVDILYVDVYDAEPIETINNVF
jgi:hypothetical protein